MSSLDVVQNAADPTSGDDVFTFTSVPVGSGAQTVVDGLAGYDTADFSAIGASLRVTSTSTSFQVGDLTFRNVERLIGGTGRDDITGGTVLSVIEGRGGDDVISAAGATTILGGAGNDTLAGGYAFGEDGADVITSPYAYGGAGDDVIRFQPGYSVADGGSGRDEMSIFVPERQSYAINVAGGSINGSPITISSIEAYTITLGYYTVPVNSTTTLNIGSSVTIDGTAGDETFTIVPTAPGSVINGVPSPGGGGSSVVRAGAGADRLIGASTADAFYGDDGADTLNGGGGRDSLYGGDGDDLVHYGANSVLDGGAGVDTLTFLTHGAGVFDMTATSAVGFENLVGSSAGDVLGGSSGANRIEGGAGGDFLASRGGDDTVLGGDGDDFLSAGSGRDRVDGGNGADTLLLDGRSELYSVQRIQDGYRLTYHGGQIDALGVERVSFDSGRTSIAFADFERAAFDPYAYLVANRDLAATVGYDAAALTANYFGGGAAQGRAPGTFDALTYIASNADLVRAYGVNARLGAEHYIVAGQNEGRATQAFDVLDYVASNPDLIGAFGLNTEAAVRHYIGAGFYEGRSTTSFDPLRYLASNLDVARQFVSDPIGATVHYITAGYAEGRSATAFDPLQYLASNFDLARVFGADATSGSLHYLGAGISEGRAVNTFDAKLYAATWVDLAQVFGLDQQAARLHYLNAGADEGRVTTGFDPVAYLLSNGDLAGMTLTQALDHWLSVGADQGRAGDARYGREQTDHLLDAVERGAFQTAGDQDWFERTFTQGQTVNISATGSSASVSVYDGAGRPVAAVNGQGDTYAISASGTYYVSVRSTTGEVGAYEIRTFSVLTARPEEAGAAAQHALALAAPQHPTGDVGGHGLLTDMTAPPWTSAQAVADADLFG